MINHKTEYIRQCRRAPVAPPVIPTGRTGQLPSVVVTTEKCSKMLVPYIIKSDIILN